MSKDPIHFCHANGFPSPVYRKLHACLEQQGFAVGYLDCHGHDSRFPISDNWTSLVDRGVVWIAKQYGFIDRITCFPSSTLKRQR